MFEAEGERIGSGGQGLLAAAWVLAFGPFAAFFFNLSANTNYHWLWQVMPWLCLAFPVATFACALAVTCRDTNIWTKLWAWAAFAMSAIQSLGVYNFEGI
jgi:hypothetical protein